MTEAAQALIQIEDLTKVFYTDEIETHALSGVHSRSLACSTRPLADTTN